VKAPGVDLNGDGSISGTSETDLGLSSYFALDITATLANPSANPTLLWEFSRSDLGFTSTGPAVVKISGLADPSDPSLGHDKKKNGKWFVVIGSGPTGGISSADHQFMGSSDQNLKLFVLDLKSGNVVRTIDTGIPEAFAGSLLNSTNDVDLDYQDEVIYVPYVKKASDGTWTDGGVGRLLTVSGAQMTPDPDPANWTFGQVIDGIGPVTSAVARLEDPNKGELWLYFGTGRYYFERDPADDPTNTRRVYGIKDPCFHLDNAAQKFISGCPSLGSLTNVTGIGDVPSNPDNINGWYINLDGAASGYRAERVITDPLALTAGLVLFTSVKPLDDVCKPSAHSYIWALKYNTGGAGGAMLRGKALIQVSTGSIAQVDMSKAFTEKDGRRADVGPGYPPVMQGLSLLSGPPPIKRALHIRER
jgi:type IV pilus assembly protein PilY1